MTASPPSISVTRTQTARAFAFIVAAVSLLLISSVSGTAQRKAGIAAAEEDAATFKEYRGVQLGMTADEVRKKLGSPKDKGNEQDLFVFGDNESAQIVYDQTHKVITISADFLSTDASVPTAKQVFGADAEAKADGSVYKMVRFPKAGYWLSYNRTGGTAPMTSITLQKIQ
ncbi:MAG TPA: hypothetical protein VGO68_02965 [Pyrinomonadaceae bacterium]|jgi:hypothetical protein|nr:hypothetical protein [Pyrinomonadaceae bacterium]